MTTTRTIPGAAAPAPVRPIPRPRTPHRPAGHPRPMYAGSRGIWKDTRSKPLMA